jgi:hypothetical protein
MVADDWRATSVDLAATRRAKGGGEPMGSIFADVREPVQTGLLQERMARMVDDLIASLPSTERLCAAERRGIIGRYCAVLEGNFIYWMTGAHLSATTEEARSVIRNNLVEEVRDCHPGMLRKFAAASHSIPDAADAIAVRPELTKVRLFVGSLSPIPIIAMMAFFEDFIRRFMPYLADLARLQGSDEFEYTTVHSICDLVHTQELYVALEAEMIAPAQLHDCSEETVLEGVRLLHALINTIIAGTVAHGCGHELDGASRPGERSAFRMPAKSEGAPENTRRRQRVN